MGKISQSAAYSASIKIVEPIQKKINETNKDIKELLTVYYRETIPLDVMKFWKSNSSWMQSCSMVYPKGVGLTKSGYKSGESIENSPSKNGSYIELQLSVEQAKTYLKLSDKRDDLKEKYNNTQKEIEQMILNLGTHKKVAENMPEVMEFLPDAPKQDMQLIVSLAPVREKVKCLVGTSEEKKCMDKIIG